MDYQNSAVDPERRLAFEWGDYTRAQRVKIWWRGIVNAATEPPPKRFGREVIIYRDDPRWEDPHTMKLVTTWYRIEDNKPNA